MTPPTAPVLERTGAPRTVGEPGDGRRPGPGGLWFPRDGRASAVVAVIRREWVAGAFGIFAVFALVTALTSFNAPERVWGTFAAVSYAVSAITAALVRRRRVSLAVLISLAGSLAAPLARMARTGTAQPEVAVIIRSAAMYVHHGTPYASPAALAVTYSWRAVAWFGAAVAGVGLVTDGITVAVHPAAAVVNTVLYPLGLTEAASPAASMLPGHMLASAGTWGHWTALALMALAGGGRHLADHPPAVGCPRRGLAARPRPGAAVRAGTRQPGRLLRVPAGPGCATREEAMLVAFSVTPLGVGDAVGEYVADAVRVVRDSGLPNQTDAMFTTVEGDWDEVMAVVRRAVDAVSAKAPRVSVVLKADIRPGATGALTAKMESLERHLAG